MTEFALGTGVEASLAGSQQPSGADVDARRPAQQAERETWRQLMERQTRPVWGMIKSNFRWSVFLSLAFALFLVFGFNDINHNDVELTHVLYTFFVFLVIVYNISSIKQKTSSIHYLDEEARIDKSPYQVGKVFTAQEIIKALKTEDTNNVYNLSIGASACAGIALFSFFCVLEGIKDIWQVGPQQLSGWDWLHIITRSIFSVPVLVVTTYTAFKQARELRTLARSLRIFTFG